MRRPKKPPILPPTPPDSAHSQAPILSSRPVGRLNKNNPGNRFLEAFWGGKKLTQGQAIKAKCAECMNYYTDGRQDCAVNHCPLYPFMPYRASRKRGKQE